jgi:signal transduction histidine kinase
MRERLHELNGQLEIESDGHGTNVRATVPHLAIARLAQAGDCRPVTASACAGACA